MREGAEKGRMGEGEKGRWGGWEDGLGKVKEKRKENQSEKSYSSDRND